MPSPLISRRCLPIFIPKRCLSLSPRRDAFSVFIPEGYQSIAGGRSAAQTSGSRPPHHASRRDARGTRQNKTPTLLAPHPRTLTLQHPRAPPLLQPAALFPSHPEGDAFSVFIPEGCQSIAGGRSAAQTSGSCPPHHASRRDARDGIRSPSSSHPAPAPTPAAHLTPEALPHRASSRFSCPVHSLTKHPYMVSYMYENHHHQCI